jgi:hypothetical protein
MEWEAVTVGLAVFACKLSLLSGLHFFTGKVLDSFKIEKRVDGFLVAFVVRFILLLAKFSAPFGYGPCQNAVKQYGDKNDGSLRYFAI